MKQIKISSHIPLILQMKTSDWSSFLQNQLPYNDRQSDDILEYNNMVTQPLDQGSIISFTHNVSTSVYQ